MESQDSTECHLLESNKMDPFSIANGTVLLPMWMHEVNPVVPMAYSSEISSTMPIQGKLSYRQQTKDCSCTCRDRAASFQISRPSLSDIGTSSGSLACAFNLNTCNLDLETGTNLWN